MVIIIFIYLIGFGYHYSYLSIYSIRPPPQSNVTANDASGAGQHGGRPVRSARLCFLGPETEGHGQGGHPLLLRPGPRKGRRPFPGGLLSERSPQGECAGDEE